MSQAMKEAVNVAVELTGQPVWLWNNVVRWRVAYAKKMRIDVRAFISIKKVVS